MVFTTQTFLFIFLPLFIFTYFIFDRLERSKYIGKFLTRIRATDVVAIIFGCIFYAWACFDNIFKLLLFVLIVYLLGRWISSSVNKSKYIIIKSNDLQDTEQELKLSVIPLSIAIIAILFFLVYFNYKEVLAKIWNWIFNDQIETKSLVAPLGLSFITFSSISYLIDVYRGDTTSGGIWDCALYLTFFPKVASGPIVLWKDFQCQIKERHMTLDKGVTGVNRIMIGFAKKVILADSFGSCIAPIGTSGIDSFTAFGTIVLYMLQIYYDFSGYSDIAIGLSNILGFDLKENFNFPYRSKSISEFWRRWHISLGTWFRQYVYFPLGGNRAGYHKTLRNLAIVFILTGIWHGAGWNYLLWGFINCFFVLLERIIQNKSFYVKTPNFVKYGFTMLIVMLFWQLFRFQNVSDVINVIGVALGTIRFDKVFYTWKYYFDMKIIVLTVIGILGATILGSPKIHRIYQNVVSKNVGFLLQEIILIGLFVISILFMVNSTYSPFIYFQY